MTIHNDPELVMTLQSVIEFIGTFAFALSGIRLAASKHYDWLGGFVSVSYTHLDVYKRQVDASLDANVRTPEIQVEGGAQYGTTEVGAWIVNWIKNA